MYIGSWHIHQSINHKILTCLLCRPSSTVSHTVVLEGLQTLRTTSHNAILICIKFHLRVERFHWRLPLRFHWWPLTSKLELCDWLTGVDFHWEIWCLLCWILTHWKSYEIPTTTIKIQNQGHVPITWCAIGTYKIRGSFMVSSTGYCQFSQTFPARRSFRVRTLTRRSYRVRSTG